MGAVDGQIERRRPVAGHLVGFDRAPALATPLERVGLVLAAVGELTAGGIAVIGGQDQPADAGGEPLDQGPEGIARELGFDLLRERRETLTRRVG